MQFQQPKSSLELVRPNEQPILIVALRPPDSQHVVTLVQKTNGKVQTKFCTTCNWT